MSDDLWSIPEPGKRVLAALEQGRLLRNAWRDTDERGREMACLLAWVSRDVEDSSAQCPADVLPRHVAFMLPWMDDASSDERHYGFMLRIAGLLDRPMTEAAWARLDLLWRRIAVVEAAMHCAAPEESAACETVIALLDRALAGDAPSDEEWVAAATAASAAWTAASAAPAAALWATATDGIMIASASASARAASLAASSERVASADRMISAMLDAWDQMAGSAGEEECAT